MERFFEIIWRIFGIIGGIVIGIIVAISIRIYLELPITLLPINDFLFQLFPGIIVGGIAGFVFKKTFAKILEILATIIFVR